MLATVPSAILVGVDGRPTRVEVHVSNGLPGFTVVGMPDATCREARDRVRAALLSSGLTWPYKRVTVNLAPPALRKVGTELDLPLALALLVADGQLDPAHLTGRAALGELGLDGRIRAVAGAVSLVEALDTDEIIVPPKSLVEARLVHRRKLRAVDDLSTLVAALRGELAWPDHPETLLSVPDASSGDLSDVRGQPAARYALEIAAAGGHHLLLVGSPGSGKTMLAQRLTGLLPDLPLEHAVEVTRVHSAAGVSLPPGAISYRPPFRNPHHGASVVSLVGGGTGAMQPGELSLAHRGVLFLDELGEFSPAVLENIRQPLEEGIVRVARAAGKVTFPARILLVGAMNPCPCGQGGIPGACRCSPVARTRYSRRLSVPLLDRFDLRVEIGRPTPAEMLAEPIEETTAQVAERVAAARARATSRGVDTNSDLPTTRLQDEAPLRAAASQFLDKALRQGHLTGRGLNGVRRVALTIADLAGDEPPLDVEHVSTALALRSDLSFVTGRTG